MRKESGEGLGTPTEPHHTPSPEAPQSPHTTPSLPSQPIETTGTIPTSTPTEISTLRQYSRRARIAQSTALPTAADEPASPLGDDSQGEACPTVFGLEALDIVCWDKLGIELGSICNTFGWIGLARVFEIKDALGNKQYKPEDIKELFRKILDDLQNIHEELAEYINTPGWNCPAFYDDDDDDDEESSNSLEDNIIYKLPPCVAITPTEPVDSLSMGDEHLDTILTTESDEFINSSVEKLIPNPSESEGENKCDVPAGFTTFSNVLFGVEYDFDSSDDQSFSNEDLPEKIYSNPLFDEEIIPMKINPHSFNAKSDLIESMPNHDSSKIDSLFDEFASELTLFKSIPPGIDETNCHPEEETHFTKRLLYDNSSPRPPEEFVSENSNVDIESFSPSRIPIKDSDSHIEEIDLSFNPDDPMPPGIEEDDDDSERDIPIL
nr:hypothetical protein [Tanacetum cinerariifolium]